MTCPLPAALPAALALALAGSAAAQTAQEFHASLEELQDLTDGRDWKKARRLLLEVLETHGAAKYVLPHWPLLSEELARCTFWQDYDLPEPEDVVPELVRWRASSGDLVLRYKKGEGRMAGEGGTGDFVDVSSEDADRRTYLHPIRFTGPYSIEFSGRSLSEREEPVVLIDWVWNSLKGLTFGSSYGVVFGYKTGIVEFERGEWSVMDECTTSPDYGRAYNYEVRVASNAISASYNGKRLLKVKRPKGPYGQFGLNDLGAFDEVEITGEVDPAWITGLVGQRVIADWRAFLEGYDPLGDVPQALREAVVGEPKRARDPWDASPGAADERTARAFEGARGYYDSDEMERGLKYVRSLSPAGVGEGVREWLLAIFLLENGEVDEARGALTRVVASDPTFYEARLWQAVLGYGREPFTDTVHALEALVLDFPKHVEPYERLAEFNLHRDRLEKAEEVLTVAAGNGFPMQALERVGRTLLRKRRGPAWPERHTYASKNYVVTSDVSKELCVRVASELEEASRNYNSRLRRVKGDQDEKFQVYFFSGEAGYSAYCEDLLGDPAESTLGLFHPTLKQLLVWDSPNPGMTERTVRHEGFHQYFDRLVGDSPVWLNEGMAEYYEQAGIEGGRWKDDQVNEEHVGLLHAVKGQWTPLGELVRLPPRAFRAKSGLHYAESWALVHYLFNGPRDAQRCMDTLLDALVEEATNDEAVERAFEGVDWEAWQSDLEAYVESLR